MVEPIEQYLWACDELIDLAGRATIQAALEGTLKPGQKALFVIDC